MTEPQAEAPLPGFKSSQDQIRFECDYLLLTLLVSVGLVFSVQFGVLELGSSRDKTLLFSALGGFLGGWTYDAKWFYRVTARGKSNQYPYRWEAHKLYWRLLIPFVAGLVAFSVYLLLSSQLLPFVIAAPASGRTSFAVSFFCGYFSDIVLSRLAKWVESTLLPKAS